MYGKELVDPPEHLSHTSTGSIDDDLAAALIGLTLGVSAFGLGVLGGAAARGR